MFCIITFDNILKVYIIHFVALGVCSKKMDEGDPKKHGHTYLQWVFALLGTFFIFGFLPFGREHWLESGKRSVLTLSFFSALLYNKSAQLHNKIFKIL